MPPAYVISFPRFLNTFPSPPQSTSSIDRPLPPSSLEVFGLLRLCTLLLSAQPLGLIRLTRSSCDFGPFPRRYHHHGRILIDHTIRARELVGNHTNSSLRLTLPRLLTASVSHFVRSSLASVRCILDSLARATTISSKESARE